MAPHFPTEPGEGISPNPTFKIIQQTEDHPTRIFLPQETTNLIGNTPLENVSAVGIGKTVNGSRLLCFFAPDQTGKLVSTGKGITFTGMINEQSEYVYKPTIDDAPADQLLHTSLTNNGFEQIEEGTYMGMLDKGFLLITTKNGKIEQVFRQPARVVNQFVALTANPKFTYIADENLLQIQAAGITIYMRHYGSIETIKQDYLIDFGDKPVDLNEVQVFLPPEVQRTDPTDLPPYGHITANEIPHLQTINGFPIARIENIMRLTLTQNEQHKVPDGEYSCSSGFLGKDEPLVGLLEADARTMESANITNRHIGGLLQIIVSLADLAGYNQAIKFSFNGEVFETKLESDGYYGPQSSPFMDGTMEAGSVIIRHLNGRQVFKFAPLLIDMILRYGFYEGMQIPYRFSPSGFVQFMGGLSGFRRLLSRKEKGE